MKIKGHGGSLELLEDCVVIRRTYVIGLFQHGLKGDKRIPYSSITALQAKRPGVLNGYIQFTIAGGNENTAGIFASASDENSLQFIDAETFDKAYEFLQKRIGRQAAPQVAVAQPVSIADQLDKLASLLERELITKEEFFAQKQLLLNPTVADAQTDAEPAEPVSESTARMQAAMDRAIENQQRIAQSATVAAPPAFGKRIASAAEH